MAYAGTCSWPGYGFWPPCPEQGIYNFYASLGMVGTGYGCKIVIKYGLLAVF